MNDEIYAMLDEPLDRSRIGKRAGAGGRQLSYLEGYDVIDRLNQIFGYDGWSSELVNIERIHDKLWRATVGIEVHFGERSVRRSDTGIGVHRSDNPEEIEKAVKEAATDALKRAARTLGNQFGNCLYDKDAPEHRPETPQRPAQAPPRPQYLQNGQAHANGNNRPPQAPQQPKAAPATNGPKLTPMQQLMAMCEKAGVAVDKHGKAAAPHLHNILKVENFSGNLTHDNVPAAFDVIAGHEAEKEAAATTPTRGQPMPVGALASEYDNEDSDPFGD